tara:strand:- start:768 stop:929 length:162 start_codon:yes stop_codon:yes gene_type:complete
MVITVIVIAQANEIIKITPDIEAILFNMYDFGFSISFLEFILCKINPERKNSR